MGPYFPDVLTVLVILTYRRMSNERLYIIIKPGVDVNKMTCFCLHAHCVRNKYPAVDCTILCVLNALGGFNFYSEGGVLPQVTQYGFFDAITAVTQ